MTSKNSSVVMLTAVLLGSLANCKAARQESQWEEVYAAAVRAQPFDQQDKTQVEWAAICSNAGHNLYKTVQTVFKGAIMEELKCKLCYRTCNVAEAELHLADAVQARIPGIQVVSQAVLVKHKPVDLWWPDCYTVAEVSGSCHYDPHSWCRMQTAKTGRSKAQRDEDKLQELRDLGFTVFVLEDYEVRNSYALDGLVQHLQSVLAN